MQRANGSTPSCTKYDRFWELYLRITNRRGEHLYRLDEIPQVAVQVCKDRDLAVWLDEWLPHNADVLIEQILKIPVEIIGIQKQKDSSASLVADPALLFWAGCFG